MNDIPTVSESGVPGYNYASWVGIIGPAGVPDEIVNKLSGEILKALAMPEIIKKLSDNGIDPYPMSASQMSNFMAADYQRMGKVIKEADISGD